MGALRHGRRNTWDKGLKAWFRQPWPSTIYPVGKRKTMLSGHGNPRTWDATEEFETVDGRNLANHLGCTKPVVNNGISTISTG